MGNLRDCPLNDTRKAVQHSNTKQEAVLLYGIGTRTSRGLNMQLDPNDRRVTRLKQALFDNRYTNTIAYQDLIDLAVSGILMRLDRCCKENEKVTREVIDNYVCDNGSDLLINCGFFSSGSKKK